MRCLGEKNRNLEFISQQRNKFSNFFLLSTSTVLTSKNMLLFCCLELVAVLLCCCLEVAQNQTPELSSWNMCCCLCPCWPLPYLSCLPYFLIIFQRNFRRGPIVCIAIQNSVIQALSKKIQTLTFWFMLCYVLVVKVVF